LADALEETTSDIAVYGIEQPGHDPSRPRSFVGVEETARLLVDQIAERLETPVMLWGHCGGASITLELARQLEERGFDLRHVFVGSKLLPTAQDMNESVEMIEGWSDDDIIRYMVDETGYALEDLRQQHIDFIARVFRHDVLNGYRYFLDASRRQAWKIRAPFTFVVAADDAALAHHPAEYGRWGKLAADVRLHVVGGGGHYFVRTNPTQTAALVQSEWDRAAAPQED
jgi:surfactin synthase thioesterase subunit